MSASRIALLVAIGTMVPAVAAAADAVPSTRMEGSFATVAVRDVCGSTRTPRLLAPDRTGTSLTFVLDRTVAGTCVPTLNILDTASNNLAPPIVLPAEPATVAVSVANASTWIATSDAYLEIASAGAIVRKPLIDGARIVALGALRDGTVVGVEALADGEYVRVVDVRARTPIGAPLPAVAATIVEGGDGAAYVGTSMNLGGAVYALDHAGPFTPMRGLRRPSGAGECTVDRAHTVWCNEQLGIASATTSIGPIVAATMSVQPRRTAPILADDSGNMWFGFAHRYADREVGELWRYDAHGALSVVYLPPDVVRDRLTETADGTLWFAAPGEIIEFSPSDGS